MKLQEQIKDYINSQPAAKAADMLALHSRILEIIPGCRLWFLDGKNNVGKTVSNPNIGYGSYSIQYADGTSKEFYQIGLSANTAGISVYILGLKDKEYLSATYAEKIGKASVTGYCIKFKKMQHINLNVLEDAIRHGVKASLRA